MDYDPAFERMLRELIGDAEKQYQIEEERHTQALRTIAQDVASRVGVLNAYLAKCGRPETSDIASPDVNLIGKLGGGSYRQMVRVWTQEHGGYVVVKELVDAVLQAGLFDQRKKAHKAMWATVSQAKAKGELEQERPGVYRLRHPVGQPLSLLNTPVKDTA